MKTSVLLFVALYATVASSEECDVAVVGAGPGGTYVAWRYAKENPKKIACLFEMGARVGGRVHSMRKQGPRADMVVEAGAYRFAPNKTCVHFGNFTYCVYTPLTGALILDALKLPYKPYNPVKGQWDSGLLKIVEADGHDAGYLTFVEAMVSSAPPNLRLRFGHELTSITSASSNASGSLSLAFANGETFLTTSLVMNVPQRPLLRVLSSSPSLFPAHAASAVAASSPPAAGESAQAMAVSRPTPAGTMTAGSPWPAALTYPTAYPMVKLYIGYDDAWWINDLKLISGMFNNSQAWKADEGPMASDDCIAAKQSPYPIQGSYHDADTRCDLPGPRKCRGFLQAAYMGDVQAVRQYEQFHFLGHDSATTLDPVSRVDHKFLLDGVHAALLAVHEKQLKAVGQAVYDKVAAMTPNGGVASIWSERVAGIEAGCHLPRTGPPLPKEEIPHKAIQPLTSDPRILVANEAFGTKECWAEGSLVMAENVAKRLGLPKPAWLPQAVYEKLIFSDAALEEERARAAEGIACASDLRMMEMAAAGARMVAT